MSNQYTDSQLLTCLESMSGRKALPEGELHLCWLAEETIDTLGGWLHFNAALLFIVLNQFKHFDLTSHQQFKLTHATWQHRVIALARVKGIEL